MGRHAGFIAMEASAASKDVNVCLIPEFKWDLHGVLLFKDFHFYKFKCWLQN